jgi:hypothetical protein
METVIGEAKLELGEPRELQPFEIVAHCTNHASLNLGRCTGRPQLFPCHWHQSSHPAEKKIVRLLKAGNSPTTILFVFLINYIHVLKWLAQ